MAAKSYQTCQNLRMNARARTYTLEKEKKATAGEFAASAETRPSSHLFQGDIFFPPALPARSLLQ